MVGGLLGKFKKLDMNRKFLVLASLALITGIFASIFDIDSLNGFIAISGSLVVAYAASYNHEVNLINSRKSEEAQRVKEFNLLIGEVRLVSTILLNTLAEIRGLYHAEQRDFRASLRYLVFQKQIDILTFNQKNALFYHGLLSINTASYKPCDETKVGNSAMMIWDLSYFIRSHTLLESRYSELEKYRELISNFIIVSGESESSKLEVSLKFESYLDKLKFIKYVTLFEEVVDSMFECLKYSLHIITEMPRSVNLYVKERYITDERVAFPSIDREKVVESIRMLEVEKPDDEDFDNELLSYLNGKKTIELVR